MLTETRWRKEQELMHGVFPEFTPFLNDGVFGFEGYLKGHRSGQVYRVVLEADEAGYPQYPPTVSMNPRIGSFWIGAPDRRRLCMDRQWRPAKSTFANTLLAVIRYLDEFDPEPSSVRVPRGLGVDDGLLPGGLDLPPRTGRSRPRLY